MMRPAFVVLAVLVALGPGAVLAAGIDCAKASTPVEKTLCADPQLRKADAAVAEAFADALRVAADPAAVRAGQREWLASRNACADAPCLAAALDARRKALAAVAAGAVRALWDKREALRARLGWPEDCEASFKNLYAPAPDGMGMDLADSGVESWSLGQGRELFLVQCDQAAYQGVYVAMETGPDGGPATLLRFPTAEVAGGRVVRRQEESLVGEVAFKDADKTLTVFTKARGVGDCGSYAVYGFDAAGKPVPRELRARDCPKKDGPYLPPERWPLVPAR